MRALPSLPLRERARFAAASLPRRANNKILLERPNVPVLVHNVLLRLLEVLKVLPNNLPDAQFVPGCHPIEQVRDAFLLLLSLRNRPLRKQYLVLNLTPLHDIPPSVTFSVLPISMAVAHTDVRSRVRRIGGVEPKLLLPALVNAKIGLWNVSLSNGHLFPPSSLHDLMHRYKVPVKGHVLVVTYVHYQGKIERGTPQGIVILTDFSIIDLANLHRHSIDSLLLQLPPVHEYRNNVAVSKPDLFPSELRRPILVRLSCRSREHNFVQDKVEVAITPFPVPREESRIVVEIKVAVGCVENGVLNDLVILERPTSSHPSLTGTVGEDTLLL
mmetsp:Transcript_23536/g.49017  ORF Transcript_23536/g.49017 Transcript_23536/m.49017 type:complete len:329 (+) Transcript_23536:434-1420(+)